jgi:hypothetical protein
MNGLLMRTWARFPGEGLATATDTADAGQAFGNRPQQHKDAIVVIRSNIGANMARSHHPNRPMRMNSSEIARLTITG